MRQWAWLPITVGLAMLAVGCASPDENSIQNRNDGIAAFQAGHRADAKRLFERTLSWRPADPQALYYMGRIACDEQEWEQAIGYFDKCLNVDPGFPTARQWLKYAEEASGLGDRARPGPPLPRD